MIHLTASLANFFFPEPSQEEEIKNQDTFDLNNYPATVITDIADLLIVIFSA